MWFELTIDSENEAADLDHLPAILRLVADRIETAGRRTIDLTNDSLDDEEE